MKNLSTISIILLLQFAFLTCIVHAQVITTNPPFPLTDQSVRISFDAREGNGGLEGYSGDVYAHTGVITSESTGPSDWKYVKTNWGENTAETKLTRTGLNTHFLDIGPSIRDFYGVPASEDILQISLVFRSADEVGGGYLEGKTETGEDIFVDVYEEDPGLVMMVNQPMEKDRVIGASEQYPVDIALSAPADITIFRDGNIEATASSSTSIDTELTTENQGDHTVVVHADNGSVLLSDTFYYAIPVIPSAAALPDNSELGLNALNDSTIRLVLAAPGKDVVVVRGTFTGWRYRSDHTMTPTPDGDYYWIEINGLDSGRYYTYQYNVDYNQEIADPYSITILDPRDDPFLDLSGWDGIPAFPEEASSNVTLYPAGGYRYNWENDGTDRPAAENMVVYELLLRDFLGDHSYTSLIDTLDYLQRLGINAIELMPVNEYEGNIGWGYNPSFHMALDKYYGNPFEFKAFVDEAHRRGMAVILDVVYNHAFSQSPLAQLYWDAGNFRPAADNPWLNVTARHPFNVGYDFNHESEWTKDFVKRVATFLLDEYHIDGFRLDLSKGFTQTFNNDVGAWGQYDASRIAILKEYADHIWSTHPETHVILEHFADNDEETELANYGMLIWGNMHGAFKNASLGSNSGSQSNFSWTDFEDRGWNDPNLVAYMESHDEERIMYENLNFGNSGPNYDITEMETALARIGMCHTFLNLFPGPKMTWEFGELGYEFSINRCEDGSIDPNCRLSPKPIRWDYYDMAMRRALFNIYRDINHLKSDQLKGLSTITKSLNGDGKSITAQSDSLSLFAVGNFGVTSTNVSLVVPSAGKWYEFFSGDSVTLTNNAFSTELSAGEYRLYTDKRVTRNSVDFSHSRNIISAGAIGISVFPNPVSSPAQIEWSLDNDIEIDEIFITDMYGRICLKSKVDQGSLNQTLSVASLARGMYHIFFITDKGLAMERLSVVR